MLDIHLGLDIKCCYEIGECVHRYGLKGPKNLGGEMGPEQLRKIKPL